MPLNARELAVRTIGEVIELPRYACEASMSCFAYERMLSLCPEGDGHGVIVFPGFLGGDHYNTMLLRLLRQLGYDAVGWEQGVNLGPREDINIGMLIGLNRLFRRSRGKVSLIGHSLGGLYARELAKKFPDRVRSVITLGSPIAAETGHGDNAATRVFRRLNGQTMEDANIKSHSIAPPVPTTSIFSKSDAIVHWQKSMQLDGHKQCENIGIIGSHCGMTSNATAWYVIADRLAQHPDHWQRFSQSGWRKLIYSAQN